jgi:hypothetical protein
MDVGIVAETAGPVVQSKWTFNRSIHQAFYQPAKANYLRSTNCTVRQSSRLLLPPTLASQFHNDELLLIRNGVIKKELLAPKIMVIARFTSSSRA